MLGHARQIECYSSVGVEVKMPKMLLHEKRPRGQLEGKKDEHDPRHLRESFHYEAGSELLRCLSFDQETPASASSRTLGEPKGGQVARKRRSSMSAMSLDVRHRCRVQEQHRTVAMA